MVSFSPRETLPKNKLAKKVAMEKLSPYQKAIDGFELSNFNGGTKFRNGDTLLARITPCLENGKTAKVSILEEGEVGFGSSEYIVMRNKPGITDADFVYYLATSPAFRELAIKSMVGTSGRQRVQQDLIESVVMSFPPLPEQRAIAATLSCLDDKIELNNRMNKTLEEMAQAIFKSWFVDFEPFQDGEFVDSELGRIPKGWRVGTLGDFFPIITGKKNANIASDKGTYPFFSCSQTISFTDDFSFDANAILVAGNGDFNVKSYNGKFEAYQRTYVLIPYDKLLVGFLYYAMKHFLNDITSGYRGSVIKFITKSNLQDYKLALPPSFSNIEAITTMQSILSSIAEIERQTQMLVKIRDSILPKLISGEICVPLEV